MCAQLSARSFLDILYFEYAKEPLSSLENNGRSPMIEHANYYWDHIQHQSRERDSESWDSRFVSFTRETGLYIYSSRKMQTRHNVECATRLCAYERSTHRAARREIEKSRSERKSERKMNEFFCVGTHIIISYSSKQAIGARLMHCRSADDFKMLEQLARGTCVKF